MSSLVAILDACVLYPMYLRDTLLRAAESGLYEARWSPDILAEVRRNLVEDVLTEPQAERLIGALHLAFPEALVEGYEDLIPAMRNQEKDRHVVAAAVRAGAHVVVTDNLRDFPLETLTPYHLAAVSSDQFLCRIFHIDPERMGDIVREQAASYRNPPRSVEDVLRRLDRHAPTFVGLVSIER